MFHAAFRAHEIARGWLSPVFPLRAKTIETYLVRSFTHMAQDYIPKSLSNLQAWLKGLETGITNDGATLGRSPAQITSDTALVDSILTPVSDALGKETAAIESAGLARSILATKNDALRTMINNYKSSPGWNDGMGQGWAVNTQSTQYDMVSHAPTIKVINEGGQMVIRGKKPGFSSVGIDMRLAGTSAWTNIGIKLNHFPFIDTIAPQVPGKPEKREYRARGYVGDQETGQPSDIVTGLYNA